MTKLSGLYDPAATPDNYDVLPAGQYAVKITGGEMKDTKRGDGKYLQVEMTVAEGEHEGRKIFDRFNLINPSQEAVRIANSQFAALREAVGVRDPKDIADMTGIRFHLMLKCERRSDKPDQMTNVVARYIERGQPAAAPRQHTDNGPKGRTAPHPDAARPDAGPPADDHERPPW